MATIHRTAILEGEIDLAGDVRIGPHCVLTGPITIGAGTTLIGDVYLQGPLTLGSNNTIYPYVCLGFAPQHAAYDPNSPGLGLTIGDDNTFREHVTVHRAFTEEGPTRIGHRNAFMATSHIAHDCQVGDDCSFVNAALVAGHVTIENRVLMGGGSALHQFVKVGEGSMIGGHQEATVGVPPWFTVTSRNCCGMINRIGLKRAGRGDELPSVQWVYDTLYRKGHTPAHALELLKEKADDPVVARYIAFIEASDRGICGGPAKSKRKNA
jgi:UDP-N-acetylglucosamine acyltransferase